MKKEGYGPQNAAALFAASTASPFRWTAALRRGDRASGAPQNPNRNGKSRRWQTAAEISRFLRIYLEKRYFFFFAAGFFAAGFLAADFLVAHFPPVAHLELVFLAAGFFTAFFTTFFAKAIPSSPSWILRGLRRRRPRQDPEPARLLVVFQLL
jgi:hypothetical protein